MLVITPAEPLVICLGADAEDVVGLLNRVKHPRGPPLCRRRILVVLIEIAIDALIIESISKCENVLAVLDGVVGVADEAGHGCRHGKIVVARGLDPNGSLAQEPA